MLLPVSAEDMTSVPATLSLLAEHGLFPCVIACGIRDWNTELSPWTAAPVYGNKPFGAGARETLCTLTEKVIPAFESAHSVDKPRYFLAGYSLAGLFALWAAYETDLFAGVAAVSPSVWFPGFREFSESRAVLASCVYLSLGDREEKAKNPVLASVGDAIRAQDMLLSQKGIPHTLDLNPGNHFADVPQRLAKGIAFILSHTA